MPRRVTFQSTLGDYPSDDYNWDGDYLDDGTGWSSSTPWKEKQISFFRPDGTTEGKDVGWCISNGFFEIEDGLWSGDWYYKQFPDEKPRKCPILGCREEFRADEDVEKHLRLSNGKAHTNYRRENGIIEGLTDEEKEQARQKEENIVKKRIKMERSALVDTVVNGRFDGCSHADIEQAKRGLQKIDEQDYKFQCPTNGCDRRFQFEGELYSHLYMESKVHHSEYTCRLKKEDNDSLQHFMEKKEQWPRVTSAKKIQKSILCYFPAQNTRSAKKRIGAKLSNKCTSDAKKMKNQEEIISDVEKFGNKFKLIEEIDLCPYYSDYMQYRRIECTDYDLDIAIEVISLHALSLIKVQSYKDHESRYPKNKDVDLVGQQDNKEEASMKKLNQILPPPPSKPSSGAYIRSLTVCFTGRLENHRSNHKFHLDTKSVDSTDYWLENGAIQDYSGNNQLYYKILGFVVTYSDEIQIEIGNLRGTHHEVTLVVATDDYITKVFTSDDNCSSLKDYSDNDMYELCVSLKDPAFTFAQGTIYSNSGGHSSSNRSKGDDNPKLEILSRLVKSNAKLLSKKHDSLGDCSANKPKRTPSRFEMFVQEYNALKEEDENDRKRILEEKEQNVYRISKSAQKDLWDWFLAKPVYIDGMVTSREKELIELEKKSRFEDDEEFRALMAVGSSNSSYKISMKTKKQKETRRREQKRKVLSIKEEEDSKELQRKVQGLSDGISWHVGTTIKKEVKKSLSEKTFDLCCKVNKNIDVEQMMMCICMTCSNPFQPAHIRSRKRCSVVGCMKSSNSCGCTVRDCLYCGTQFCDSCQSNHDCRSSLSSRCGWKDGGQRLKFSYYCGSLISDDMNTRSTDDKCLSPKGCEKCGINSCEHCKVPCQGPRDLHKCTFGTYWCDGCLAPKSWERTGAFPCGKCFGLDDQILHHESCSSGDSTYNFTDDDDNNRNGDDDDYDDHELTQPS